MDKIKILITGAGGLIGNAFFNYLKNKDGIEVIGIDDFSRFPERRYIDVIDISVSDFVKNNKNDFDKIFHFAAINGTSNFYDRPTEVAKNNITCDLSIISFVETNIKCKLIYASSSEVIAGTNNYPTSEESDLHLCDITNPRWSYRIPKIFSENYLYNSNIDFCIIRFFNIFSENSGPGHFIHDVVKKLKSDNYTLTGANETRCFCHVDDIVISIDIVSDIINRDTINIGSDEEITVYDAANILAKALDMNPDWKLTDSLAGSTNRRKPDLTKLKNLHKEFSPRSFEKVINDIKEKL